MKKPKLRIFRIRATGTFTGRKGKTFKSNFEFPIATRAKKPSRSYLLEQAFFRIRKQSPDVRNLLVYV